MPLQSIGNLTPYEKLHGHKPTYEHLRAFGCICYVSTSKVNRTKFDGREKSCVFIGHSPSHKGYKILDPKSNKISIF